eukprot:3114111-Prymnesium_polylepis.1
MSLRPLLAALLLLLQLDEEPPPSAGCHPGQAAHRASTLLAAHLRREAVRKVRPHLQRAEHRGCFGCASAPIGGALAIGVPPLAPLRLTLRIVARPHPLDAAELIFYFVHHDLVLVTRALARLGRAGRRAGHA